MSNPTGILIIDLETQNHPYFGAIASPRHPDNYVVAEGHCIDYPGAPGQVVGTYYESRPERWLHIPDDVWLIVAHNAPFELDWMLVQERDEIVKFLSRGGRIWDTAYAEYLITNQQETYPDLNTTAQKYGGTPKVDGIKILWEQGVKTADIDRDLLMEYLAGPGGDVENTRKVFYGQYAIMSERGMLNMFFARCAGLVYNALAMWAGLHVSREVAFKQLTEGEAEVAAFIEKFQNVRALPDHVTFKESSDYHMSAWLFGGPIKYKIRDVWFEDDGVTPKYEKVKCYKFGDSFVPVKPDGETNMTPENFEACVLAYGTVDRYKAGKSKGQPKVHDVPSDKPKLKWYDRTYDCKPLVKLALLPPDVRKAFCDEFTGKRKLADDSPVFSTGSDALEVLSKRLEFSEEVRGILQDLLWYSKLDKDLGTYYLREVKDEEGNVIKVSGMLQYLTEHNVIYHILNATSTVTTRLSSTKPNMQNLPRGDGDGETSYRSGVKEVFTSRFDDPQWLQWAVGHSVITRELYDECLAGIEAGEQNGYIIEVDYSALEVVTLAAFSGDRNLVQALLNGIDMHCLRLAKKLGEDYHEVERKCKDESHPDHKAYKKMRTEIKPPSFAYQYGATAMGISFATGCTLEYAEEFIANEKALFPEVEAWYEDEIFAKVEANTSIHRELGEDGKYRVYKRGVWVSPAGTHYEFRQYPKRKYIDGRPVELMEFKPTQMRNYPIQGESGFFVQTVAGIVAYEFVRRRFWDGRAFIINQVHDALYADAHKSVAREVGLYMRNTMEQLPAIMKPLGYDLSVPFPAEAEMGPNMKSKHKIV